MGGRNSHFESSEIVFPGSFCIFFFCQLSCAKWNRNAITKDELVEFGQELGSQRDRESEN